MCEVRGFLPCMPTEGKALPKRALETGVSRDYQRGPQGQAWNTNTAAAATKNPVCKHRSLSTHTPGACAAHHCQGPVIQGQLPQENTLCDSGCCNLMLASAAAGSSCILYPSLPPAWVSQNPLISCCFIPVLTGQEQRPEDDLHTELGPKPKLTPGAVWTKKRKGNLSQQPQEQRIKSPQPIWYTLHLWNTWRDKESSQNWGSRFGEQLQTWGLLSATDLLLIFMFILV